MKTDIYNTRVWTDRFIRREPADSFDEERVNRILQTIPPEVETILDVGTGGGYIYRKLEDKKGIRCFGVDISLESVKKLGGNNACVSDVESLPFKDEAFDLVLAADVIEHLKEEFFKKGISEIVRVSKKYILINSPYKDAIGWPVSLCPRCAREFNIYGHLRRVDMKLIKALFPEERFVIIKRGASRRKRNFRPNLLVYMARRLGKVYSREGVVCPYCFNTSIGYPHRSFFEKFFGSAIGTIFFLMDKLVPTIFKSGNELYVLLQKV